MCNLIDRLIHERGIGSSHPFAFHRTPGFGDCNGRTDVIFRAARGAGSRAASISKPGMPPIYRGELEMTGQIFVLKYLKRCRGGSFVRSSLRGY
jgi:hypothetical protein